MWQGLLSNYKHRDLHKDPSTGSGSFKAKGSICMTVGGGLFCWDVFDGHIQAANSMCEITGHEGDEGEGHGHGESMCSSVAPFTVPERSLTGDIFLHPTLFPCYNNTVVIRVLSKKKHWKELATAKRKLSAVFHATAVQTPVIGCTSPSTRWNKISLCSFFEVPVFHHAQHIHVPDKTTVRGREIPEDSCQIWSKVAIPSSLFNHPSTRLLRQTVRHVKVKDWHQMKDCFKSELPKLYAHHLSCYQ